MAMQTTGIQGRALPQAARENLEKLRLQFIERSRGELRVIRDLLRSEMLKSDRAGFVATFSPLAHALVGAAGIFGFPALSDAAFDVETFIAQPDWDEQGLAAVMDELLKQLEDL